jgi:hypothetical protein
MIYFRIWTHTDGGPGLTPVVPDTEQWLDLSDYEDATVFLDVPEGTARSSVQLGRRRRRSGRKRR